MDMNTVKVAEIEAELKSLRDQVEALEAREAELEKALEIQSYEDIVGRYFQMDPDDVAEDKTFLHVLSVSADEAQTVEVCLLQGGHTQLARSSWNASCFVDPDEWPYMKTSTMVEFDAAFTQALATITGR